MYGTFWCCESILLAPPPSLDASLCFLISFLTWRVCSAEELHRSWDDISGTKELLWAIHRERKILNMLAITLTTSRRRDSRDNIKKSRRLVNSWYGWWFYWALDGMTLALFWKKKTLYLSVIWPGHVTLFSWTLNNMFSNSKFTKQSSYSFICVYLTYDLLMIFF